MNNKDFYHSLSLSRRISFNRSMEDAVNAFLSKNFNLIDRYKSSELLLSDIYFHWLRYSAEKNYKWCSDTSDFLLNNDFFEETKITLYVCFCKNKLKFSKKAKKKESY